MAGTVLVILGTLLPQSFGSILRSQNIVLRAILSEATVLSRVKIDELLTFTSSRTTFWLRVVSLQYYFTSRVRCPWLRSVVNERCLQVLLKFELVSLLSNQFVVCSRGSTGRGWNFLKSVRHDTLSLVLALHFERGQNVILRRLSHLAGCVSTLWRCLTGRVSLPCRSVATLASRFQWLGSPRDWLPLVCILLMGLFATGSGVFGVM